MTSSSIAILGAGLSGLVLARGLCQHAAVTVFEKSRGVGGRMATRYTDDGEFDHGAQFFTARSAAFQTFLQPYLTASVVQDWTPHIVTLETGKKPYKRDWFEPHYVATPRMNSLCKTLLEQVTSHITFHLKTHILQLERTDNQWLLTDKDGMQYGPFDTVISTAPAKQTRDLFGEAFCTQTGWDDPVMTGCHALMIALHDAPPFPWHAAKVKESPLSWIAVNSSKPRRAAAPPTLLIHTANDWSEAHIDEDLATVEPYLMQTLYALTDLTPAHVKSVTLHRWRYANTPRPLQDGPFLHDPATGLAAASDWCVDGRVEGAFLSATALTQQITN